MTRRAEIIRISKCLCSRICGQNGHRFSKHLRNGDISQCFGGHPFRQSLPPQQSPRPFETAEKPRKRWLLHTKLLTAASAKNAVLVSLSPVVSKAPDFAILVRNFKRLILNGYSARRTRTFRIPPVVRGALRSKRGVEIAAASSTAIKLH